MSFVSWVKHGLLKQPKPVPPHHTDYGEALIDAYCVGGSISGYKTYLDVKKELTTEEWKWLAGHYKKGLQELSDSGDGDKT